MDRNFKQLTYHNLKEIRDYALDELERFLYSNQGKYEVYENNLIAICLCQGSAQHYLDTLNSDLYDVKVLIDETEIINLERKMKGIRFENGQVKNGIRDIDVWLFFAEDNTIKIPHINNNRITTIEYLSNIGKIQFDFMKKTINRKVINKSEVIESKEIIKSYLMNARTESSKFLSQKSIIGLYPPEIFAKPIWKVKRMYK